MKKIALLLLLAILTPAPPAGSQESRPKVPPIEWPNSWPPDLVDSLSHLDLAVPPKDARLFLQTCSLQREIFHLLRRDKNDEKLTELGEGALARLYDFAFFCSTTGQGDTFDDLTDSVDQEVADLKGAEDSANRVRTSRVLDNYVRISGKMLTVHYAVLVLEQTGSAEIFRRGADYDNLVGRYNALVERYNKVADNSAELRSTLLELQVDNAILRANQRLLAMPRPTSLNCTATTIDYGYGFKRTQMNCH